MADRIIKPDSGNDVVVQNNAGTRKIEVTNSGDVEVTGDVKTTTVKATNLKANDGTAALVVSNSTGQITSSAKIDLNGNELILDADDDTSITADTDDQIDFRAGGTDSVKIGNEHLTINDGNLVIGTAGHGIDFSVNSHASGMTSEIFDDYETGTFSVTGISGSSTFSSSSPPTLTTTAQYVKIGKVVTVLASFSHGTTGWNGTQWILGGIPFNPVQGACCSWGVTTRTHIQSQATHMWNLTTAGQLEGVYIAQDVGGASALLTENTGGTSRTPNINFTLTYITT